MQMRLGVPPHSSYKKTQEYLQIVLFAVEGLQIGPEYTAEREKGQRTHLDMKNTTEQNKCYLIRGEKLEPN